MAAYDEPQVPRLSQASAQQKNALYSLAGMFAGMVALYWFGWRRI